MRVAILLLLLTIWLLPALADESVPKAQMLAPGVISTDGNEFGGTMTPDGTEIYFTRSVPLSYMYAIYRSRKVDGRWTRPELVPFSGHGRDFDANISPDGRRLVFTSDRQVHPDVPRTGAYKLWYVDRMPDGKWSEPRPFDAPINRDVLKASMHEGNEWFGSLASDGTLYFASDRNNTTMSIYRARFANGSYQQPELLPDTITAGAITGEPMIAPDQSFLLFSALGKKENVGPRKNWDIYISRRAPDGSWLTAENLGPAVNTPQRDYSPRLEPDGHTLIFTSERYFGTHLDHPLNWHELLTDLASLQNGEGNIYEIDLRALHLTS